MRGGDHHNHNHEFGALRSGGSEEDAGGDDADERNFYLAFEKEPEMQEWLDDVYERAGAGSRLGTAASRPWGFAHKVHVSMDAKGEELVVCDVPFLSCRFPSFFFSFFFSFLDLEIVGGGDRR